MQDTGGYNPYKGGVVGASDSHNTGVPYRQENFFGGHASLDGNIKERMAGHLFAGLDTRLENPAGLAGVWAEENTRESIFNAMQRKETFGVSGPHIKVRFFGGWQYTADMIESADWVKTGYAKGVPVGGDLPSASGGAKAPTFMLWAVKDPTSGNLDRIQIVKGWSQSGQSFEKIYDVVWAGDRKADKWSGRVPAIQSTVDIDNASYTNSVGSVELKKVWTDPDFDPNLNAFYYARALEIPTPRWTTIQAHELGIPPPGAIPATVQERAWTSPIWYTPTAEASKAAKHSPTVKELKSKGAVALNDAQLKELIVDKSVWVQNTVTGEKFKVVSSASGKKLPSAHSAITGEQIKAEPPKKLTPIDPGYVTSQFAENQGERVIYHVGTGKPAATPSDVGDVALGGYLGIPTPYYINNGKIVTPLVGTPIEVTVYKLGDKLIAARNNEFGYANYELIKPQEFMIEPPAAQNP